MNTMRVSTLAAATVVALSAGAATAETIDFTDSTVWTSAFSTDEVLGATVSVSATPGGLNFDQAFDGPAGATGGLSELSDGLGVGNDEISPGQTATVSFSNPLFVTGLSFLDIFAGVSGDVEVAQATFSDGTTLSFAGIEPFSPGGAGFLSVTFDAIQTTSIAFSILASDNDDVGVADFSLAAVLVAPIPIPPAGLMLLSGFAGAALLARRRRRV